MLVVDDSMLNRKMLIRVLTKEGFQCYEADDGSTAIEFIMKTMYGRPETPAESEKYLNEPAMPSRIDVILMDYVMEKINGPDATSEIRRLGFKSVIFGVSIFI